MLSVFDVSRARAATPPLPAFGRTGFPEFGHFIEWPKSETSDFGERSPRGYATRRVRGLSARRAFEGAPHPNPLPVKNGERERTACVARTGV